MQTQTPWASLGGCAVGFLSCLHVLLGYPKKLAAEITKAAATIQGGAECDRNTDRAVRHFKESLKSGLYRVPEPGGRRFFFFRSIEDIVRGWFRNSRFQRELVALPVRNSGGSPDARKPSSYQFVRHFRQPCWRSNDGMTIWVGEVVHCIVSNAPVRITNFQLAADGLDVGDRFADAPVRVAVKLGEYRYTDTNNAAIDEIKGPTEDSVVELADLQSFNLREPRSI